MRKRIAPETDKVVVAYYDTRRCPITFVFDFLGLPAGSAWRTARCNEYRRMIDALKAQGCEVHVWAPTDWPRYRTAFINDTLYGRKS